MIEKPSHATVSYAKRLNEQDERDWENSANFWANFIVGAFMVLICVLVCFGFYGCLNSIENSWNKYEAEERNKARAVIDDATSEERAEARESNRRSREYEKQWELEKALRHLED